MTLRVLSATDVAIATASKDGTLKLTDHVSRFGEAFVAISDDVGLIEVATTREAAQARVAECIV